MRTALTVLGIVLGVAVAVAIQTANSDVLKSFEQSVIAAAGRATIQVSGGELGLDERLIQDVIRHPDVVSSTPVIQLSARVVGGPHQGRLLSIMALDVLDVADAKSLRFRGRDGARSSLDTLLSSQALFVGTRLADEWDLHVGSELRIATGMREYDLVVAGLIESDFHRPSVWDTIGIMDIAAAQTLFGLIGRLDRIDIVTEPGRPVGQVIEELRAMLPPSVTVSRPSSRTDQIEHMTRAFQLNLTVLSMVSLLVGLFLVYNTVSFAVVRRRREIGMLSAMGMSRRTVTGLFIGEAAALGLIGGLLGTGCGVLLAKGLLSRLSRTISDLYVSVDATVVEVSLVRFVFDLPLSVWVDGAALGTIVSMLGALVPSWDAGQTAPAKALAPGDYESTQTARVPLLAWTGMLLLLLAGLFALPGPVRGMPVFGYGAALCLLLGLSCVIPLVIRLFGRAWSAATVLSMVSLLVGLFLVYNTVSFAVVRRRREIGMLSAMGMSRRTVTGLFIGEAAALGLIGGLLGTGCGVLLAKGLLSRLSRTISDLYVSVDATVVEVSLVRFVFDLPLSVWVDGAALGTIVSMLGALVPSWDAGQTAPAKALAPGDYESTQTARVPLLAWTGMLLLLLAGLFALPGPVRGMPVFGYGAALCLLLGLSCVIPLVIRLFGRAWSAAGELCTPSSGRVGLPIVARLAADQISRAPGRNAVTISAMMVGISIMVGVDTMVGSFRETVREWIDQTVMADLIVAPATWLHGHETGQLANRIPLSWAESLSAIPGVAALDTYRDVFVELKGHRVALVSRDLRVHAERSRYLMVQGNSATVLNEAVAKHGVVVSEVLARTMDLHAGETIQLTTPSGEKEFPILGIFLDYATDGGKIVMDRGVYRQLWRDDTTTVIPIYVETGADRALVRRLLDERVRGMAGSTDRQTPLMVISNAELKQEIMEIFDRTFTVTSVLELIAMIIAVLGIVNTLVLSVLQRRRELAMLRSLGTTMGQVRRLMVWESGYLGLLGGFLGVLGGMLLSVLLIEVINKQSFGWTIRFSLQPWVMVQAVALSFGAAFIAAYIPAQWAGRQSIAEGLRYE